MYANKNKCGNRSVLQPTTQKLLTAIYTVAFAIVAERIQRYGWLHRPPLTTKTRNENASNNNRRLASCFKLYNYNSSYYIFPPIKAALCTKQELRRGLQGNRRQKTRAINGSRTDPRIGSGGVRNLMGRVWSGRVGFGQVGSDWVGSVHPDPARPASNDPTRKNTRKIRLVIGDLGTGYGRAGYTP